MKRIYLWAMILAAGLTACSDDKDNDEIGPGLPPESTVNAQFIVVNEGTFMDGNAELTVFTKDGVVIQDIFDRVNDMPLGDVAQELAYIDGRYFVSMSNSGKINVIDPTDFQLIDIVTFEQDAMPNRIAAVNDSVAVVSDFYPNLSLVNTRTLKVEQVVTLFDAAVYEKYVSSMEVAGDKLFCATYGDGFLVFDLDDISREGLRYVEGIEGTLPFVSTIVTDKTGKLWTVATEWGEGIILNRIDPATEKVDKTVLLPYAQPDTEDYVAGAPIQSESNFNFFLATDRSGGTLYFNADILVPDMDEEGTELLIECPAVYTYDVDRGTVSGEPYRVLSEVQMLYGLNVSPEGDLFACDCIGYLTEAQRGFLRRYRTDGSVDNTRVGLFPKAVHFTAYEK